MEKEGRRAMIAPARSVRHESPRRLRVALIAQSVSPQLRDVLAGTELAAFKFLVGTAPAAANALPDSINVVLCVIDGEPREARLIAAGARNASGRVPILILAPAAEAYLDLAEAGLDTASYLIAEGLTSAVLRRALLLAIRRAREKAQQHSSEEHYKRLYENSSVPIYELDLEGNLISANQAMVELFEYPSEAELLAAQAARSHFVSANERREWLALLQSKKKLVKYRKSMLTREGRRLELLDTTYLVHDEAGKPVCYQGSITDFTEMHELGKRLAYETNHDSLTALPNRRAFEYQLEQAIDESRTDGTVHALCYFDLDQFKVVNDTFGHAAGDELLRKLGGALASRTANYDTLARVGGDEFALLLRNKGLEQSTEVANDLLEAIRNFRLRWGERDIDVGASIGVVPIDENTTSLNELLTAADTACYTAKEKGRNRVHVQEPDDKTIKRRISEMQLVMEAKHALQENRMRLFHQPIRALPLAAEDQLRFEILIRMLDWDGNLVPPGLFLPAIEKYNLSKSVDCWVIDHFLTWLAAMPDAVAKLAYGSINVSGLSLGDADFLNYICAQLDAHEIQGDKICFEITETAAIHNVAAAQNFIATLKTRGCRFALDDFGSGTSSFGYLKNLRIDTVKIDGMFVRALRQSDTDRVIVKSINDVAHSMGLRTVAEFVEDAETLTIVTELGIDFAQGYAVGMPELLSVPEVRPGAGKQSRASA
jgi:diguanylate cyclase (GGDEF)-like protein/PAS domain S-box-containing protein